MVTYLVEQIILPMGMETYFEALHANESDRVRSSIIDIIMYQEKVNLMRLFSRSKFQSIVLFAVFVLFVFSATDAEITSLLDYYSCRFATVTRRLTLLHVGLSFKRLYYTVLSDIR